MYAAEHDTSINALVRELLEDKVTQQKRARAAADRILDIASRGPYTAVDPGLIRREELHERW